MIHEKLESLTYSTDGGQGIRIAFGVFVFLIAMVPTTIVAVQWLSRSDRAELPTSPWSILPGAAIAVFGLYLAAGREHVTIDPHEKTVTWIQSLGGLEVGRIVWKWEEVTAIHICANITKGSKPRGYNAQVSGPRGTRVLLSYFEFYRAPPEEIRATSRMLGLAPELIK